ncbi:MAG: polyprenyl synthetase family protein [Treponema sp.]|jgi:octaprenyl-diphosphate synthase|nr:polyprenyl synthetase family protein [Treponema sp.]
MERLYTLRLERIEAVLDRWLPHNPGQGWAAEVFPDLAGGLDRHKLGAVAAPGRDLLSRGGKRWRPLLMTLVCEALGGGDAALPLVPLVEFCHNASLIHDDIEDSSDERRGQPAVHIVHGVDAAINGGCFLYFLPLACIDAWAANLEPATADFCKAEIYSLWGGYMRKLHLGQAIDIDWHRNFEPIPSVEEYRAMCALKTGCLARFAAELGAAAAGASGAARQLGEAAEKLGVGFQILDDVKNLTTGLPGKRRGDDIVEGKKSLPVLMFLHRWPEKKGMVKRCFGVARSGGVSVPEVEELIQALLADGILAEAEEQGKDLMAEARTIFAETENAFRAAGEGALFSGFIDQIL